MALTARSERFIYEVTAQFQKPIFHVLQAPQSPETLSAFQLALDNLRQTVKMAPDTLDFREIFVALTENKTYFGKLLAAEIAKHRSFSTKHLNWKLRHLIISTDDAELLKSYVSNLETPTQRSRHLSAFLRQAGTRFSDLVSCRHELLKSGLIFDAAPSVIHSAVQDLIRQSQVSHATYLLEKIQVPPGVVTKLLLLAFRHSWIDRQIQSHIALSDVLAVDTDRPPYAKWIQLFHCIFTRWPKLDGRLVDEALHSIRQRPNTVAVDSQYSDRSLTELLKQFIDQSQSLQLFCALLETPTVLEIYRRGLIQTDDDLQQLLIVTPKQPKSTSHLITRL